MFKDYYNFKKRDKRIRWVYDREASVWKREATPRYSDRFLNIYLIWWLALAGLLFYLALIYTNIPFTHRLKMVIFDSPLLFLDWFFYVLCMLIFGFFLKRFWPVLLVCTVLSTIVFFASDMLLLNYDTPLYIYIGLGFAVSFVYALAAQFIRFLIRREPKENKKTNKKTHQNLS